MKVNISMAKNKEKAYFYKQIVPLMRVTSLTITFKGKDCTSGLMGGHSMASGKITKWKGEENLHGMMAGTMMEITKMIRSMVTESSPGLTE